MARFGGFSYRAEGTRLRIWDWSRIGLEFVLHRAGRAAGRMYCLQPAIGRQAELAARTDILMVNGARAFMVDVGPWGSEWIVVNANPATPAAGSWFPNGTIRTNATPEGAIAAPVGSDAVDVLTGTRYRKNTGTGNTGWASY